MERKSVELGKTSLQNVVTKEGLRDYYVHRPHRIGRNAAVVIALHGAGSDALGMEQFCGLTDTAEKHGFCVVYPQGTGRTPAARTWNAGGDAQYAARQKIDDIGFLEQVMFRLRHEFQLNTDRVYLVGMSNGAALAYRAAVEIPHRVAAVAAIGGCLSSEIPNPTRPVPVIHFHGTEDTFVPYLGGMGRSLSRTPMHSVSKTIAIWVQANGASTDPIREEISEKVPDGTSIVRTWHPSLDGTADVELWTIHGGGHTWPGRRCPFPFLGKSTQNLDANETLWRFFERVSPPQGPQGRGL